MRIKSVEPRHFGPFTKGQVIELDESVTVLTGANDVGKSALLRLIQRFCEKTPAEESDVNRQRLFDFSGDWKQDPEIGAVFKISLGEGDNPAAWFVTPRDLRGGTVEVQVKMQPEGGGRNIKGAAGGQVTHSKPSGTMNNTPHAIVLPQDKLGIRDIIPIDGQNDVENQFLKAAFGEVTREKLEAMNPLNFSSYVNEAGDRISDKARDILPVELGYAFRFSSLDGKRDQIAVEILDANRGYTPIGYRGTGARKLLTLLGILTSTGLDSGNHVVLFDEPENSLHADAQRRLRTILEAVGAKENVQVVYSTHSPVMMNPLYPSRTRVLVRDSVDGVATTKVSTPATDGNYLKVRTTLGMLPSDSLLFADVAVIVEGDSECRAIPILLLRLSADGKEGFEDVERLLANCHFVNGGGDSFDKLARVATSQGSSPIIFLDGDKQRRSRNLPNTEALNGVPVVELSEGLELEDIVPREDYLRAVAETHELDTEKITPDAFAKWKTDTELPSYFAQKMFTKQIDDWLVAEFQSYLSKPKAMEQAARVVDLSKVSEIAAFHNLLLEVAKAGR
tara:strand:+ start:82781 stop:84472 length:1692 start_codon:yes stop_codon:yes gene_type:complete